MLQPKSYLAALWMAACAGIFSPSLGAIEIAPATAVDIVRALGPDARGLDLAQEDLPDLFTLTSSRIEEDATRFMFEVPYMSGRWKGGRAVLEYARDLSYTLVNIYDRNGRRQRIYSVKTQYAEHIARVRSGQIVASRSSTSTRSSASSIPAGGAYEWDDEKGAYVPIASSSEADAPQEEELIEDIPEESPADATEKTVSAKSSKQMSGSRDIRRKRKGAQREETVVAVLPAQARAGTPATMGSGGLWVPTTSKKGASKAKPSEAARPRSVKVGDTKWVERRQEREKPASKTVSKTGLGSQPSAHTPSPAQPAPIAKGETQKAAVPEVTRVVDVDSELSAPRKSIPSPTSTKRQDSSKATFSEEHVPTEEDLLAEEPAPARSAVPAVPEEPMPEPSAGPTTADSDAWVPKDVKTPVVREPELPKEASRVALAKPVDSSLDNLLKMAGESQGAMPRDSDAWVPKKAIATSNEAELNKEIQRVRRQEKERVKEVAPKTPIRKDINNPEEGVLPVSSFEKMSGPMYGRHREYERRFRPGAKANSKAPKHDFYVDEVDRKKEFHNIYFYQYQKGKPPRLVAVQRHQKVTFRGNYDIDKEDEGKLTIYN